MSGEDISYWRIQHNLTQQQLADLLGIHRVALARWESGARQSPWFLKLALERLEQLLEDNPSAHAA